MRSLSLLLVASVFGWTRAAVAQGAPDIVWQAPTPNTLDNSVLAVAWSPTADLLAVGSTDRWFRLRQASTGTLQSSILEPPHSHGVAQILFSTDGALIGVRNESSGLSFRVQRTSDGTFLGSIVATVGAGGIVTFAPDSMLLASTGGDGTLSRWSFSDVTVFRTTGSGYQQVTTAFDFSPDGLLQSAASNGRLVIKDRASGALLRRMRGGSEVEFSPDSSLLAAWSSAPVNEIVIWRTSDWSVVQRLRSPNAIEGVAGLRFTRDGTRLVATGYAPFQDASGAWQQTGFIRFWDVLTGTAIVTYDEDTDLAVTSPVTWSPDGALFGYGLYDGTVAVARTP